MRPGALGKSTSRLGLISSINDGHIKESLEPFVTASEDILRGEVLLLEVKEVALFNSVGKMELDNGLICFTNFQIIISFPVCSFSLLCTVNNY